MGKKRFTDDSFRREPWFRALCQAFISCQTEEDMANLLRDVGTLSELQAWSERLEIAKQLAQGLSYRKVAENTGGSTTTVTRVARCIENGEGGYRKTLNVHRHHRLLQKSDAAPPPSSPPSPASSPPSDAPRPDAVLQKYLGKR